MNAGIFISQLINELPEVKSHILDEDNLGLISLQIMSFRAFTQKAIDNNDLKLVKRCFTFVDRVWDIVDLQINNSLYISYLGKLHFKGDNQALNLLPIKLSAAIKELNQAYNIGTKNTRLNNFLKS